MAEGALGGALGRGMGTELETLIPSLQRWAQAG